MSRRTRERHHQLHARRAAAAGRAADIAPTVRPPPAPVDAPVATTTNATDAVADPGGVTTTTLPPVQAAAQAVGGGKANLKPWPPGTSGNPAGYSHRRRISDALTQMIDEKGLAKDFATTWIAMALGQTIPNRDPRLAWFEGLVDRVDGPLNRGPDAAVVTTPDDVEPTVDAATAERVLRAANGPEEPDDEPTNRT